MQILIGRLKALSDMTRLKILKLILERELNVCELARLLNISQPAVSQHLRRLKAVGLATEDRRGQWIYYSASRDVLLNLSLELSNLFCCSLNDLDEFSEILPLLNSTEDFAADCRSLKDTD